MTYVELQPHVKPPDVATRDRDVGGAIAFVVFGVAVGALFVALRRIRARALIERADRELRDAIDESAKELR